MNVELGKAETYQLRDAPFVMDARQRAMVCEAIVQVCAVRDWQLLALNARTNHVHVVVVASIRPELVMLKFKEWSTKHVRGRGLVDPERRLWARHGSTRYLTAYQGVDAAVTYVMDRQGADIPGCKPASMVESRHGTETM